MTAVTTSFSYLQELVLDRSGVLLADDQEYLLEARLAPLARELGMASGSALLDMLRRDRDRQLADRVVEAMVTGETSWFRDIHPFEVLRTRIIPRLVECRRNDRALSVWSAACSSGQELYSIAMLLDHYFPETGNWNLRLVGTDLSTLAIKRAREGLYSTLEVNRGLPAALLTKYFYREGPKFRVAESLRSALRFDTMNLVRDWMPVRAFDIVLLRNVLIYFDVALKKKVLAETWNHVADGGYLVLGATETVIGLTDDLTPTMVPTSIDGATFYEKVKP